MSVQSDYAMRIVHVPTGEYVEWAPGQLIEAVIVDAVCERVRQKGVGVGRTEAHVLADLREALLDLLKGLKKQV